MKHLRRCEEERKVWAKHWQCDSEVQGVEDKPWRNEEVRSLEEGLPQLRERNCKLQRVVSCDGFHPKALLDLSRTTKGKW